MWRAAGPPQNPTLHPRTNMSHGFKPINCDLLRNYVVQTRAGRISPSCSVDRYVSRSIPLSFGSGRENEGRDSPEYQGDLPIGALQLPLHAETPFFATGERIRLPKGPLRFASGYRPSFPTDVMINVAAYRSDDSYITDAQALQVTI